MLMDRELLSVLGEHAAGESPVLAQQATEELENREARVGAQEHKVDTDETQMREGVSDCDVWKMNSRLESWGRDRVEDRITSLDEPRQDRAKRTVPPRVRPQVQALPRFG